MERAKAAERKLAQLEKETIRNKQQFERIVELTAQLVAHSTHISENYRALVARALSTNDDWQQAIRKIVTLNPNNSAAASPALHHYRWLMRPIVAMPERVITLLEPEKFVIADASVQNLWADKESYSELEKLFDCEISRIDTARAGDINQLEDIDLLVTDLVGPELASLTNGHGTLQNVTTVQVEVTFGHLPGQQTDFREIDRFLSENGFFLMDFAQPRYLTFSEHPVAYGGSRIGSADAIYVKADPHVRAMGPEKILKAAVLAHYVYGQWDLTAHLFRFYDDLAGERLLPAYQETLRKQVFRSTSSTETNN